MKAKMTNRTHIEGYLYQHSLEERVTKADSTVPNTHSSNISLHYLSGIPSAEVQHHKS